jgi:LPXTG-motif cell wall-anchored protein
MRTPPAESVRSAPETSSLFGVILASLLIGFVLGLLARRRKAGSP